MRTHFEFRRILHLVLMAALNFAKWITQLPFLLFEILWKLETLVVVCVGNIPL
jgi:hypothetical protein